LERMPREALIKKLEHQLLSGKYDIGNVTIQYLTEIEKLLFRKLRQDLQIKVKNLQNELNELKKENNYLHSERNALKEIRKIIVAYKSKYESDATEANPSQIFEIIEDDETKSTFEKLEIPEILAEIANNLSPRSILNFLLVNKSIYQKMHGHFKEYQNFWRNYFFQFPKELSRLEALVLYRYKQCLHCKNEITDP
ncbi:13434_t:CDS:2, partial [Gigaspora rosea]